MSSDRQHVDIVSRDGESVVVRVEPSGERGVVVSGEQLRGLAALAQVIAERDGDEASEALHEQLVELVQLVERAFAPPQARAGAELGVVVGSSAAVRDRGGQRAMLSAVPASSRPMRIARRVEGAEDRACVLDDVGGGTAALIVADGAGGQAGAAQAAELFVSAIAQVLGVHTGVAPPAPALVQLLRAIDRNIFVSSEAGETTAVVAFCNGAQVWGASVGDSAVMMLDGERLRDLTAEQKRRPFIGSGEAEPRAFGPVDVSGPLLVCSDGLHKYCRRGQLARSLAGAAAGALTAQQAVDALVEAARLPSEGAQPAWPDDIAVIVVLT